MSSKSNGDSGGGTVISVSFSAVPFVTGLRGSSSLCTVSRRGLGTSSLSLLVGVSGVGVCVVGGVGEGGGGLVADDL